MDQLGHRFHLWRMALSLASASPTSRYGCSSRGSALTPKKCMSTSSATCGLASGIPTHSIPRHVTGPTICGSGSPSTPNSSPSRPDTSARVPRTWPTPWSVPSAPPWRQAVCRCAGGMASNYALTPSPPASGSGSATPPRAASHGVSPWYCSMVESSNTPQRSWDYHGQEYAPDLAGGSVEATGRPSGWRRVSKGSSSLA